MTTNPSKNVFNIAVEGNFDDCQKLVKEMFSDNEFSKSINMSGVNSINWARIVAQTVYYFFCYFKLDAQEKISFSVPTGNFGDVYAGYLAKKMGLPIDKLLVATNENDILHRAISKGDYKANKVQETISPSMDIQVASNFERLLFDIYNEDSNKVVEIMNNIKSNKFNLDQSSLKKIQNDFISESLNEKEILDTIKSIYKNSGIIIDPHTAIGAGAVKKHNGKNYVVLATAHPSKFPDAIFKAIGKKEELPSHLKSILNQKEQYVVFKNNIQNLKSYIKKFRMKLKIKDIIPDVEVFQLINNEPVKIRIKKMFKEKKSILLGMPGAFTSVCSSKHLPGYLNNIDRFKSKGIDLIACIAVNDPFVMNAWGKKQNVHENILMLGDPFLTFTKSIGAEVDKSGRGLGIRSNRYTMLIEDNKILQIQEEKETGMCEISAAENFLNLI